MGDRRRINGPPGDTTPPIFALPAEALRSQRVDRTREPNEIRKIFLKTGLTPSASGSAYLELEPLPATALNLSLAKTGSALKLSCTVHGPRPLPRSAPFTPQILLSTHIKYAPFASRQRRGYVRDASERDLAVHLETALRGVIISKRWPKSGLDVMITVLEGEEDSISGSEDVSEEQGRTGAWGIMSLLSGCITVASAAIADAGIDCVDLVTGGVAAIVRPAGTIAERTSNAAITSSENPTTIVKDICPAVHEKIFAICVVGYLQSRDEITEIWIKGDATTPAGGKSREQSRLDVLIEKAIEAAMAARLVLKKALMESTELQVQRSKLNQT